MARDVRLRIQHFIDELSASLAGHLDEPVERQMRSLLALLQAAAQSAEELEALLSRTRKPMLGRARAE